MVDSGSGEALAALELLITEFFFPATNNERKRDIENMLDSFSSQTGSWKHCLYFVDKTSNQYVSMYALNTIENIINRKYNSLNTEEKSNLRCCVWTHLTAHHLRLPTFLRNKLIKIIVDIAKNEWPLGYQDFYTSIMEMLRHGGNDAVLGLQILRALTEGFDSSGALLADLSHQRRRELEHLLVRLTPWLVTVLTDILQTLMLDDIEKNSPDPPPSPERGAELLRPNPLDPAMIPDLLMAPNTSSKSGVYAAVGEDCVMLCLNILQNLFAWLPVSTHLQPDLVTNVFHWASAATQTQYDDEVCLAGMGAVNELLYRRLSLLDSAGALRLSRAAARLIRFLTTPAPELPLTSLSTEYLDKVSEFLRLFVSQHFKRLEAESKFDSLDFLLLIYIYTFQVPKCSSFVLCIDVWIHFIEDLKPQDSHKYAEVLSGLAERILNKILFQQNNAELSKFNNEIVDDDGETEWQKFLNHCIECIAKVGELAPLHIFNLVLKEWQKAAAPLVGGSHARLQLLDLASLTQLLGRLAPTLFQDFDDATKKQCAGHAELFLKSLLGVLDYVTSANQYHAHIPKPTYDAFIQVHANILACVGGLAPYMPREVPGGPLIQAAAPLLMPLPKDAPPMPPVLSHAAAHLLLSVAVSVRVSDPLVHLHDLLPQAQQSLSHLQPKTASVVRQALCVMVLECPGAHAAARAPFCAGLIESWCSPLLQPGAAPAAACQACLPQLAELLRYFANHNTQTKKLLAVAVHKPIEAALATFQNSNGDSEVSSLVLELFLALLGSLHQQLGSSFVHQSITMFMDVAKRQEHGALQRLLQLLKLCVEGGAVGGEAALSEVLALCIDHVLPLAQAEDGDPDVTFALFDLFGSILLNRWQHFYSSCVRLGWSPAAGADGCPGGAGSPEGEGERSAHVPHFRALLHAIVASFQRDHIDVFRLNLNTLDRLNVRWKLYQKAVFRGEMTGQVLEVLVSGLLRRSAAALLQDEVAAACHSLASVDFTYFFRSFLPSFLASLPALQPQHTRQILSAPQDTDLPSFTRNLISMINDIRCYEMTV